MYLIMQNRIYILATTKRLRQQPAVRRERLVAAAEGCVCAVCVLFPNTSAGLRTLPSPNAEPVPSLFISQHIQYYNQRRESRQEKPLLSLTRFFLSALSLYGENQND